MSQLIRDSVLETTTTEGDSDPFSLLGAEPGYNSFRAFPDGAWVAYVCRHDTRDASGNLISRDEEIGIGKITYGTPDTISRDHVISSTNSGAKVDFGAGTKDIFCAPAGLLVGWRCNEVESRSDDRVLTLLDHGLLLAYDTSGGDITQVLPAGSGVFPGFRLGFMKTTNDTGKLILDGAGAETINAAATYAVRAQHAIVWLVWTGTEWLVDGQAQGWTEAWLPAAAFVPDTTQPCLDLARNDIGAAEQIYLPFQAGQLQRANAQIMAPPDWDGEGIEFYVHWYAASSSTNPALWSVRLVLNRAGVALTGDSAILPFDDFANGGNGVLNVSQLTPPGGIGGAPLDMLTLQVGRSGNNAADTLAVEARFLGLRVRFRKG